MLLDEFHVAQLIFQVNYPIAFDIWDRAGALSKSIGKIWPGVDITRDIEPSSIALRGKGFQITTKIDQGTVVLNNPKKIDALAISRISDTFGVWRDALELKELSRLSTRIIYALNFEDSASANSRVMRLLKEELPERVFNQDMSSGNNAIEKRWRFLDEKSFTNISIRTEDLKFELQNDANIEEWNQDPLIIHRLAIDFDRGLKQVPPPDKLRADDWIKGVIHVARRDIEKLL